MAWGLFFAILGPLTCTFMGGADDGTRTHDTHDTQDHNGVVELQPFLGVNEIILARQLERLQVPAG